MFSAYFSFFLCQFSTSPFDTKQPLQDKQPQIALTLLLLLEKDLQAEPQLQHSNDLEK